MTSAVATIRSATSGEVELTRKVLHSGAEACPGCPYIEICDRRKVSSLCLCGKHSPEKDVYGLYEKTFAESIELKAIPTILGASRDFQSARNRCSISV